MLYWAAVFLVIGLVAMLLGAGGIAGVSMNIAWILFVVGIVMAIVFFVSWIATHAYAEEEDR
jgi:uncharacterized membrane protein YtjA (UPF0391 family)